jgi:hypothetical protein
LTYERRSTNAPVAIPLAALLIPPTATQTDFDVQLTSNKV